MNPSQLAQALLSWETKRKELDALEEQIKAAVLALGKTQTVGNVRASYSNGRTSYDYETPGRLHGDPGIIEAHTEPVTNWRKVCQEQGIPAIVIGRSDPSVSVKLL